MENIKLGFIGAGNMARSLIGGLIADGFAAKNIWASDPSADKLAALADAFAVHTSAENQPIVDNTDVVVLAVKPQVMKAVASALDASARPDTLFISVAAGIQLDALGAWLGGQPALIRCMPNTPALVRSGATAMCANARVSERQREIAESVLRAVGVTVWVGEEAMVDTVTALSGSGPAYFFLVMEALERAAIKLGLPDDTARLLTLQTAFGAAKMALESEEDVQHLRERVTSPGGTTERAIEVLRAGELEALFERALNAAQQRSIELAKELGK
ncbi:MAG: pyrroline-5-carboxylate reductase [Gammaproteobacteria bacterium SG8_47]|nr:MAG: pyrroline-5-carboxylate reductase [Gammaproteobacteria bacterium SG8_47]